MKFERWPFKIEKQYRLRNWDYSEVGFYFVTICAKDHVDYFGKIDNEKMELSKIGEMVKEQIKQMVTKFPNIRNDAFVIMPNHVHILIQIQKYHVNVGTYCNTFLQNNKIKFLSAKTSQTIPVVIRYLKSSVKHDCNLAGIKFFWQPRYHDRIIRNEKEYWTIRQYIKNNLKNWGKDKENKLLYS